MPSPGDWNPVGNSRAKPSPSGDHALAYRDLKVLDANGRKLPSHLALAGKDTLEIHVRAKDAIYPIVVSEEK